MTATTSTTHTTTTTTTTTANTSNNGIVNDQLTSLDDTDCYASVWEEILQRQRQQKADHGGSYNLWGGRGKGGRGLARRTIQPFDVIVEDVRLQYLSSKGKGAGSSSTANSNKSSLLLDSATLKLLHGHVYALIGKNGCGKSTLLQRMHAQKIPGWSTKWTTLYLPSDLPEKYRTTTADEEDVEQEQQEEEAEGKMNPSTPLDVVLDYHREMHKDSQTAIQMSIEELEAKLDALNVEEQPEETERLCEALSLLEDRLQSGDSDDDVTEQRAMDALQAVGLDEIQSSGTVCSDMSRGQQKRLLLAVALLCAPEVNVLLLDEPTNHLDVWGLIQLRQLLETISMTCSTTVVMVSHDVDLINDVATDIIDMAGQKLYYFPGNYDSYRLLREQQGLKELRKSVAMEKKTTQLLTTLQHLKEQPVPRRGGAKKKAKAVASHKKKLERHEGEQKRKEKQQLKDQPHQQHIAQTTAAMTKSANRKLTAAQRLKLAETMKAVPDKAIQFVIRETPSVWGGPLITALDVGHGFDEDAIAKSKQPPLQSPVGVDGSNRVDNDGMLRIVKKEGFLFDCVDLCIEEGSKNCILGHSGCGKTTLLKLLSKQLSPPVEGKIHHASGVRVAYFDAEVIEEMIGSTSTSTSTTPLQFLTDRFPTKSEQDIRGQLTNFGLSPKIQAKSPIGFLSGGEKARFVLATIMFDDPPVLCMDNPTCHLDVESVQALSYGLRHWNGTLVMVCHDASFIRSLGDDVKCAVLIPEEGKLRRVEGGIDAYLRSFQY